MDRICRPAPGLEKFVRFFAQRVMKIGGPPVVQPVTARAMPLMLFALGDSYKALVNRQRLLKNSNTVTLVGPQTYRRVDLHLQGAYQDFAIFFQPDGVYRLFSIPMHELIDEDYEGHAVLGGLYFAGPSTSGRMRVLRGARDSDSGTLMATGPCFAGLRRHLGSGASDPSGWRPRPDRRSRRLQRVEHAPVRAAVYRAGGNEAQALREDRKV